jgi:hypothetical protein
LGSIKAREFLDYLRDYQLLKDSSPCIRIIGCTACPGYQTHMTCNYVAIYAPRLSIDTNEHMELCNYLKENAKLTQKFRLLNQCRLMIRLSGGE